MASENCATCVFDSVICQPDVNVIISEKNVKSSAVEINTSRTIKRRQILNLETKIQVIKDSEAGLSQREVAMKYKCGKTQIGNIIKQKEVLLKEWATSTDRTRKRKRSEPYEELNSLVWEWYQEALKKELPINGPILQAKAKEYASLLDIPTFAASNGWLNSFRKRHGIFFHKGVNKENDETSSQIGEWKSHIASVLKEYSPKDIYNIQETKLLFRSVPSESNSNENAISNQISTNERLSITLCCNALGEKESLLIVSDHFMPSYLKEIDTHKLNIKWHYNENSWVTEGIFKEYLKEINEKMKSECRKIVIFTGDIACHLSTIELSHISIKLLPSYTVTLSLPLDLGVINSFKLLYRKKLLRHLIARIDDENDLIKISEKINIVQAIKWVATSWTEVKPELITKCFKISSIMGGGKALSCTTDDSSQKLPNLCELVGISAICKNVECFNTIFSEIEANLLPAVSNCSTVKDITIAKEIYDTKSSNVLHFQPEEGLKTLCRLRNFFYDDSCLTNDSKLFDAIDIIETKLEDVIIRNKMKATVLSNS